MYVTAYGGLPHGFDGRLVEVQVDVAGGSLPRFDLVGLAATAVKEARQRLPAAFRNCGLRFPSRKVTINLAPAELRKEGAGLDLAMAVAVWLAAQRKSAPPASAFVGELGLDGTVRHVDGVLVTALGLRSAGIEELFVAECDAAEAALAPGLKVRACHDLAQVLGWLSGLEPAPETPRPSLSVEYAPPADDLAEVHGQLGARRALEIAAAGEHHVLFAGPPGAGKTMLARCLPGILPALDWEEALEVAKIRSLAGELVRENPLDFARPFRSPHHGVSQVGLVGGGSRLARPGEISRAHLGVLFLDELAQFPAPALQALRQPLESGRVTITRAAGSVTYPARFQLVAATNPCPCGWAGDPAARCRCTPTAIASYQRGLSGPLLDRIDLRVWVSRPPIAALSAERGGEPSEAVRQRVLQARARQLARQGCLNSALRAPGLRRFARLPAGGQDQLERWGARGAISARGVHRAWRVARTVADLEESAEVGETHLLEALGYRVMENAA